MATLDIIEGIDLRWIQLLQDAGISSVAQLIEAGRTQVGRRTLSHKADIDQHRIHEWIKQVDLTRVDGIGKDYAELLVLVGVGSVNVLARQDPEELRDTLSRCNHTHHMVRRIPNLSRIERWISDANRIQPIIHL